MECSTLARCVYAAMNFMVKYRKSVKIITGGLTICSHVCRSQKSWPEGKKIPKTRRNVEKQRATAEKCIDR